jgi:manganese/zinc/iron transport system substrate-binding protein
MGFRVVLIALACGVLACGIVLGVFSGCGSSTAKPPGHQRPGPIAIEHPYSGPYPIQVTCTTGMVADLARIVGGDKVEVTQLMGEGVDPHLYKASTGDVRLLNGADLVFYSGLHLEGKMSDVFVRMARQKPTFAVTEYIEESSVLDNDEGAYDPHLWFDVSLWSQAAGVVRDVLVAFDPPNADGYRSRAAAYQKELDELHRYAREQLATIPKSRRVLITAHDAFRYFGRAYDIEVKGIQGISTESEAGVKEINALVDFITRRGVKAVFVETSVPDRNIKALLEGCKARGHEVVIGGELFSDAMGKPGTPEGSYIGMVRHNVDTITKALR